jgi:hypothetical protein
LYFAWKIEAGPPAKAGVSPCDEPVLDPGRRAFSSDPSVRYIMGKITVVTKVTPPIQIITEMT